VKSIQLGPCELRPEDYRTVVDFARSIGLHIYLNAKGFARFTAPSGVLTIRELRSGRASRELDLTKQLSMEVSNLAFVRSIAESMQLKIISAEEEPSNFTVELPGNLSFLVVESPDQEVKEIEGTLRGTDKHFAAVVSRFNAFITERLLQGALDGLTRLGASIKNIYVARVPGAFEIPLAARKLAETKKYDAIICLGCLLRGDTAHYDVIVNEVTRGIGQSAQETGVPHAFGVLTCENLEQAIDRAGLKMGNKGFEAALAAVEMASLTSEIQNPASVAGKKQIPRAARNDKPEKLRNDKPEKIGNRKSKKTARSNKKRK
jgi:6,7-dimethyl-8-ribityllumazine synthase